MSYINENTLEYPLSERQVKSNYPNTSFPKPFVAPEPFAWVFPSPQPEYDEITQSIRESDPVKTSEGTWAQQWEVYALDPEEAQANLDEAIYSARAAAHSRINDAYEQRARAMAEGYPEAEQKSWYVQIAEAAIVLDSDDQPTPWIDAAAPARGVTREALATLIQAQDTAYRQYHGMLTGTRQALRDQIDAVPPDANAPAALGAINWPENEPNNEL